MGFFPLGGLLGGGAGEVHPSELVRAVHTSDMWHK